jgi:hypothetical protein
MAVSDNPLGRAPIRVSAQATGARYSAPSSNAALELAQSLQSIEPTVGKSLSLIANRKAEEANVNARKDAITTNGANLADAVRAGTIKPTQNPWYMQAYAREAAAVSTRTALGALQADSASWAERNDPKAFAARWSSEVAKVGENYSGVDQNAGFVPVAAQFGQQVIASNQAQAVQRIETERTQNVSSLLATDLSKATVAHGGTLTAGDVAETITAARANWIGTGGDEAGWNHVVAGAITSAGYQTHNSAIIDLLKDPSLSYDGKKSIYGIIGVADAAESDRYRIEQAARAAAGGRMAGLQAADIQKGQEAFTKMLSDPADGKALLLGRFNTSELVNKWEAQGYTVPQIRAALSLAKDAVGDSSSLANSSMSLNGQNPETASAVVTLHEDIIAHGMTPSNKVRLTQLVANGDIRESEALSLQGLAHTIARQAESDDRADARAAKSDARAAASDARRDAADGTKAVARGRQVALNYAASAATSVAGIIQRGPGKGRATASADMLKRAQTTAVQAYASHLALNPDDTQGATLAAHTAVQEWGHNQLAVRGGGATTKATPSGGNPNRKQ